MDRNPNASSSSMRDLTRTQPPLPPPPFSSSLPPPPPPPPPPDPSFSHPQPSHGLVVVGFIARRRSDVSQLINRIIDSDVFGSSNRYGSLRIAGEEVEDWLKNRKIEYYLDEESRILYVQLCSMKCPAMVSDLEELKLGFDSVLEEHEFRDLQGMLFMFTVCHVIVYIQEGSSFNTQVLRKFRVLQHAKHALTPILRSQGTLPSFSRPPSSTLRSPTSATSSKSPSPRRGSGMSNRSSSGVSVLSGLGLHTMLFPGQCTPVTLFAFLDDFSDMTNGTATAEESSDSSSSQSTDVSILGRPGLPVKGSGPVVMLARPANKCEGGLRKKLQSSLEAQIRFLIKKCRTLTGLESNHSGSRSAALSGSSPLLTLDASRAVVLLDSSVIQKGKSLCFATDLVEEVLNGKATPDSLLLESHSQTGNNEDLATLKEFIFRQADILRGKGGPVANANSGSAAGVGMVAVAAAAAAASAASGKTTSAPELPNLGTWLSSSQLILKEIFCVKNGYLREADVNGGEAWQRNGTIPQGEGIAFKGADSLCAATFLQSGKGINRKFSTLWCQRVLPAAMQVYLKDLPACYPTSLHEAHLEKALRAFYSMVKGPLVQDFAKRLEDECTSIWKSGRQLCDAISLTGKPCMHQRHDAPSDGMSADAVGKGHRSGFVFLHACACGRSRRLRPDPFDFEAANFTFNNFPDCDMLLPALQLPKLYTAESIQPSSWIVVRVGGAGYYEPSKGLLQSGFLTNQKFLLKWTITLDKDEKNVSFANAVRQGTMIVSATGPENESNMDFKKGDIALVKPGETQTSTGGRGKSVDKPKAEDKMISFGRGLPNITMKKAFSEVVAGSASADSAFPPLQPKKPLLHGPGKGGKKTAARDGSREHIDTGCDSLMSVRAEEMPSGSESATGMHAFTDTDAKPFLQIGSNVVPLNVDDRGNANEKSLDDGGRMKFSPSSENFVVYVGFEHECPHGHRFILSPELLNKLDSPYSLLEESPIVSVENVENKHSDHLKLGKVDGNIMSNRQAKGTNVALKSMRSLEKAGGRRTNGSIFEKGLSHSSKKAELYQESVRSSADPGQSKKFVNLDDNGQAVSILNRNLPIYMSCPYCRVSKNKEDQQSEMFAGTLSQLQRIFVVTPPFPLVLATNPVIKFEASCQPSNVSSLKQQLQFSLGCQVILPPESFVSIRLPFIYGAKFEDSGLIPLKPLDDRPQLTAWIVGGTALQVKRSRD